MKQVLKYLESRAKEVNSNHPLLRDWLDNDDIEADKKFLFSPMALHFVMEFRYFCRYYAKFDEPVDDELQRVLNVHLEEDETHSGMYLDDWDAARVSDSLVGWSPRDLLWWLTSAHTAHVRRANLELNRLAHAHPDPLLRFAIIQTMEALFQTVLSRTVDITRRTSAPSSHYPYWGETHLALEKGHAQQADDTRLREAELSPSQRQLAMELVTRTSELVEFQGVEWSKHAQEVHQGTWNFHPADQAREEGRVLRPKGAAAALGPAALCSALQLSYPVVAGGRQREAAAALRQEAFDELWQAPFNVWVRDAEAWGGDFRGMLRRHILLPWIVEFWAMADFWQLDATYPDPRTPLERGINRASALLAAQCSKRRYAEWELLGMDDFTGWSSLSQALRYFWLDEGVDKRRAILVALRKLTYRFPEPRHRYWIVKCVAGFRDALVRSVGAAMDSAGVRAEEEDNFVLFAGHAERLHPELPPDPEADEAVAALERHPLSEPDAAVICDHIIPALKQQEMERLQLSFESVTNQRGKLKVVKEYAGAAAAAPLPAPVAAMASTSPPAAAHARHGGRALAKAFPCRAPPGAVMACNVKQGSTRWLIPGHLQLQAASHPRRDVNDAPPRALLPASPRLPLLSRLLVK